MELGNFKIVEVNISSISIGDTIVHLDGNVRTVNNNDIKRSFMGITIFGDSYKLGTVTVKKIIIAGLL